MPTILIADDDPKLTTMLRRMLAHEGYDVLIAATGWEALAQAEAYHPDLIVLDWRMPQLDGLEVAKRLRSVDSTSATPVLMLTARGTVADRVAGLDSGADDYLVKPFAPAEFLARIRARLRVVRPSDEYTPLTYADLSLDPLTRETRRGERPFSLSPREFDLLAALLRHPRQVLSRARLLQEVWGYAYDGADTVLEVYIGYLRSKTEAAGEARLIQTVRGIGYVLRED
jgi:two-component system response regulator MprA